MPRGESLTRSAGSIFYCGLACPGQGKRQWVSRISGTVSPTPAIDERAGACAVAPDQSIECIRVDREKAWCRCTQGGAAHSSSPPDGLGVGWKARAFHAGDRGCDMIPRARNGGEQASTMNRVSRALSSVVQALQELVLALGSHVPLH